MPHLKKYGIFISHAWTYNDEYYRLVKMLNAPILFQWRNLSVPEHDPIVMSRKSSSLLSKELTDQIRPAHVVIILAGMYVVYRDWIQHEMDISLNFNKPIIGIKPWASQKTPSVVQQVAKEIVGWNTPSIINAIRRHSL